MLGNALIILDSPLLDDSRAEPIIEKILDIPEGQLSPKQLAMARFARAQLLFAQGKSEEAQAEQEQALLVQPRNPDIHVMIGRRQFREGNYELAVESIRRAIEYEPNRAGFHIDLARILMGMPGRESAREAVASVERALATFPENPSLLILLGAAHEAAEDVEAALESYEKANELRESGVPEALLAMGSLQRRQRDFDAAAESFEKATDIYQRR
ncbi:MAG: tetratricopeptide repeat protein, partial [Myxococcota bacterium]